MTGHHIVFDSQCELCTELAQLLTSHAEGRVVPLSIRDPRAVRLLDRALPGGWSAQPYLVTAGAGRPSAVAGWRLALRVVRLVGLGRSVALVRSMQAAARRRRSR